MCVLRAPKVVKYKLVRRFCYRRQMAVLSPFSIFP
jgi:hypothetical protein